MLNLPDEILDALQQGKLAYTKAQAIAWLKDEDQRQELLQTAITQNLSLTEIKEQIAEIKSKQTIAPTADQSPPIRNRIDAALRQVKRSKALDDPKKQRKIERLLAQLEAITASSMQDFRLQVCSLLKLLTSAIAGLSLLPKCNEQH